MSDPQAEGGGPGGSASAGPVGTQSGAQGEQQGPALGGTADTSASAPPAGVSDERGGDLSSRSCPRTTVRYGA